MTETTPEKRLNRTAILEMARTFGGSCILGAAAELDVWSVLGDQRLTGDELASRLGADPRGARMLLDALTAMHLLMKDEEHYSAPIELRPLLTTGSPESILPMILHSMNILRHWSQLAWIVKAGILPPRQASIRGFDADRAAFIAAMHVASGPIADELVTKLGQLEFRRILDVGGASGTWTIAFLKSVGSAQATIFDLPDAIQQARERFAASPLANRINFVAGDFYRDELPRGFDFAWISAIIHQHGREENRALFAKVSRALEPGGQIGIRDFVMEPSRTRPVAGAMFAINMLANTERGGTFTLAEITEDLESAGFRDVELPVRSEEMSSVVLARKPK